MRSPAPTPHRRPTPAFLRATREYLGLTTAALAGYLGVRERTLRAWESGRDPIPYRVGDEVTQLQADTGAAVQQLVDLLRAADDPVVGVHDTDAQLHAARPDAAGLTARWWRTVAVRASMQVPGTRIESAAG